MVPFSRIELGLFGACFFLLGFAVAYLGFGVPPAQTHSPSWEGGYDWIVARRSVPGGADALTECRTYVDDAMHLLDGFGSGADFLAGCLAAVQGKPR